MAKTPDEYHLKYNLEAVTIENIQEDIKRFDTQLAQQIMQNINNQQGNNNRFNHGPHRGRPYGRLRQSFRGQTFRPRPNFHQNSVQQHFHSGNFIYFHTAINFKKFLHPGYIIVSLFRTIQSHDKLSVSNIS